MKKTILLAASVIALMCAGCNSKGGGTEGEDPDEKGQVALYDKEKAAIVYIDYDDEATIYMWEGTPVAYLVSDHAVTPADEVYGFSGKCLGWYHEGVLYGRDGYAVGARHGVLKGAINMNVTQIERVKGVKHVKPLKSVREVRPVQHVFLNNWSETALEDFFTEEE